MSEEILNDGEEKTTPVEAAPAEETKPAAE